MRVRAAGVLAASILCLATSPGGGASAVQDADRLPTPIEKALRPPRAPGEFLVRFRAGADAVRRGALLGGLRARLDQVLPIGPDDAQPIHRIRIPEGADEAAALKQLTGDPAVLYAEPNYRVFKTDTLPNDPRFGALWGLRNTGQPSPSGLPAGTPGADVRASAAWDLRTDGTSVVVAVLDTGVDYTHEDLAANIWVNAGETAANGVDDDGNGFIDDVHGWDFAGAGSSPPSGAQDADPMDIEGHGTHVAGTIGAVGNNGVGVAGVAWSARIMALRFLAPEGGYTSDAIAAYSYVMRMKSRGVNLVAVNNSWGGIGFSQGLRDAIHAAGQAGILSVCAAGNSGINVDEFPHYPSGYDLPSVISVGASDRRDGVPLFSNFGAEGVDLFAPGVEILSTVPAGVLSGDGTPGYDTYNGTSMATPHVTGAAVLLASHHAGIGVAEMRARLLFNVDKRDGFAGRSVTCGRLDVRRALEDVDASAPGPVADLAAPETSYAAVLLEWTAPGDDGAAGQASAYEIRRSTSPITSGNFGSATRVDCPPPPASGGTAQTFRVCGLQSGTTYYFALRAFDNVGNASPISNAVSAVTQAASAAAVVFQDDFEAGGGAFDPARWATVTGTWARRIDGASKRASDSSGDYGHNASMSIITAAINLTGKVDATLSFVHSYDFETGYDFGLVQASVDGGATWRWLGQYTSTNGGYGAVDRLCLADYDGLPDVRLRFRTLTDSDNPIGTQFDGWNIDNVRVLAQRSGPNNPPVADAKSVGTNEDAAAAVGLTGSDPDGDPLTFAIVSGPSHGVLSGTPPSVTYTPSANYAGPDSFTFRVSDGALQSAAATVSITVTAVDDPPVATAQAVSTAEDMPKGVALAGSDAEGASLTFAVVGGPSHGTLSGTAPNLTYTPSADYAGPDSFTFRVSDGTQQSVPATVSITVTPVNDPPTASSTAVVVGQGGSLSITLSGSDPEGDALTYQVSVAPQGGTLTGTGPTYVYTPSPGFTGQDSLTFTVSDGAATSAPAVVTFDAPAPPASGGGGGGSCGLLGVETLLLLALLGRRR